MLNYETDGQNAAKSMNGSTKRDAPNHQVYITNDIVCFSHLRWNFVFQRPQHLFSRFAKFRRAFYFEEPLFEQVAGPYVKTERSSENVVVVTPVLPHAGTADEHLAMLRRLVDEMLEENNIKSPTFWYYTPMALKFTGHITPHMTIYDCMDELSLFKGAPPELLPLEQQLLKQASVVFTGGHALFEAKRHTHSNIHPVPSSIDFNHFSKAREKAEIAEPADQASIPHPRVGFFGVVDERFNIELLAEVSKLKPQLHFVVIGPVVKIDPATLPQAENIHYLGMKSYQELPSYIAGWDAAILPFALNESTRYISPTKTPEYLAGGCPVVSTSITDVIRPYGDMGLVEIADTAADFGQAIERGIEMSLNDRDWRKRVDEFLKQSSWDMAFGRMTELEAAVQKNKISPYRENSNSRSSWRNLDIGGSQPRSASSSLNAQLFVQRTAYQNGGN